MFTKLKQLLSLLLIFTFFSTLKAQNSYWVKIKNSEVSQKEILKRNTTPQDYDLYQLDMETFNSALHSAPVRGKIQGKSALIMDFPTPEGELEQFRVTESPVTPEGLSARYPEIKTYKAVGVDDPTSTMRFSITQFGLHTMSSSGKIGQSFIDPYTADLEVYIVYSKKELPADKRSFECYTEEGNVEDFGMRPNNMQETSYNGDDSTLRKYRLALSAHKDYGDVFAANSEEGEEKADIMAQMVIAVNRVNEIFERDLGITLEFVENNDDLIFYTGIGENPWAGADGILDYFFGDFNNRSQLVIDDIIGDENYDIGHNFNTSGGGNAGCLSCVCISGQKGSAYTGLPNPIGDPFYIDFVAHEMGHQFGGYHVMNTCSRSGNGMTEVEPASGSTIMGYAGVCQYNVAFDSDAHFNYVNIRDIQQNIQVGNSTCGELIDTENLPPEADAGADYVIPKSTAFILKGEGVDPDGSETLTYEWAQNDPEQAATSGPLSSNLTSGALYRSYPPKDTPERYMPPLEEVVAGNLVTTWEVTPAVGRELNFSFVVRDNGSGFADAVGQTDSDLMKVTVDGDAGPFEVISQNEEEVEWVFDTTEEIAWEVADTDNEEIDAQEVDILLSIDGGETFDIILAEGVSNNGSAEVTVPEIETTEARIMIRASENIFYAVNETEFTITEEMGVETDEISKLAVYPNPNDGHFNISFEPVNGETVVIQVFDLQGRLVYNKEYEGVANFDKQIHLSDASAGLYILRIENAAKTINKKLIVR
ncbi:MAG TPA: zinc-dependent metalloprotease family protein [Flavobacteriaceae bacterium]|nr:zinc-dependent metalloprotease family protein [Flavobacteriaceae bacterium]